MFWSKVLSAELLKVEEEFPYFISMAALEYKEGIKPVQVFATKDGKKHLLCTLSKDCLNQTLNIEIEPMEVVSFSVVGKGVVYLTGFSKEDDDLDDIMGDSLDEDEAPELELDSSRKAEKRPANANKNDSKRSKLLLDEASEDEDESDLEEDEEEEEEEEEVAQKPVKNQKQESAKKPAQNKKMVLKGNVVAVDIKVGSGKEAKVNSRLSVTYTGRLQNGKLFDSNAGSRPFKFRLGKGEVIRGWDIGMKGMKVGGKRTLVIPANMAYGNKKIEGIPANSTLLFDVELLGVN